MGKVIYLFPKALSRSEKEPSRFVVFAVNVLMLLGTIIIISAAVVTSRQLVDQVVFTVLVPGVVVGLILIVVATSIGRRYGVQGGNGEK